MRIVKSIRKWQEMARNCLTRFFHPRADSLLPTKYTTQYLQTSFPPFLPHVILAFPHASSVSKIESPQAILSATPPMLISPVVPSSLPYNRCHSCSNKKNTMACLAYVATTLNFPRHSRIYSSHHSYGSASASPLPVSSCPSF